MKKRHFRISKFKESLLQKLSQEEREKLDLLSNFVKNLKHKHSLVSTHILDLLQEDLNIPDSVFHKDLTILESIVKYLKENLDLSYSEIASLISRDERNIWHTYNNALKKYPIPFGIKEPDLLIPLSIFRNKSLSILENATKFLKENLQLSYQEIGTTLKRDNRTIWLVYNKAINKMKKS